MKNPVRKCILFYLLISVFMPLLTITSYAEEEIETISKQNINEIQEYNREEKNIDFSIYTADQKIISFQKNGSEQIVSVNEDLLNEKSSEISEGNDYTYSFLDDQAFWLMVKTDQGYILIMNHIKDIEDIYADIREGIGHIELFLNIADGRLEPCDYRTLQLVSPKYMVLEKSFQGNKGFWQLSDNIGTTIYQTESCDHFEVDLYDPLQIRLSDKDLFFQTIDKPYEDQSTGWKAFEDNGKTRYLYVNKDGHSAYGWKYTSDGEIFYFDDNGVALSGIYFINGRRYVFKENGALENTIDYLRTKTGRGWYQIGNQWYYLDRNLQLLKGDVRIGQFTYHFNEKGMVVNSWIRKNGVLWCKDKYGQIQTGWVYIDGDYYYAKENGGYATGWMEDQGKEYYLNENGQMAKGWQNIDGRLYYFDMYGTKMSEWTHIGPEWYYLKKEGGFETGWKKISAEDGKEYWYYFNNDGVMQTGWLKQEEGMYYLKNNGTMAKYWTKIRGRWYFFDKSGIMLTNRWIDDYYVTEDGSMAVDEWIGQYYVDETGLWQPEAIK